MVQIRRQLHSVPRLAYLLILVLAGCGGAASAPASPSRAGVPPASGGASAAPAPASAKPAASASAAPTASAKPAAQSQATIKMGAQGQFSEVGVYVAIERGYFKDLGVDVQVVPITTVGQEMPLLATGQLDFGAGGGGDPAFFNAVLRGVDAKIAGPNTIAGPNGDVTAGIVVRKDLIDSGQYKSPKDLKGRTVAVVSEHTLAEYVVAGALKKDGLTLNDIKLVTLPFPDTPAAFANKGIDAAFLVEPFVTAVSAQGMGKLMVPSGDVLPNAVGNVMMMSPASARDKQDASQRFVTGWLRGQRDYYHAFDVKDYPSLQQPVVDALIKHTAIKDPKTYQQIGLPWIEPNGVLNPTSIDTLQDYYIATGVQAQKVDLSTVVDQAFVQNAVKQLGKV